MERENSLNDKFAHTHKESDRDSLKETTDTHVHMCMRAANERETLWLVREIRRYATIATVCCTSIDDYDVIVK